MKPSKFDPFLKSTNGRDIKPIFWVLSMVFLFGQIINPRAVRNFVRKKFFTPNTKPLTNSQRNWLQKAKSFEIFSREKKIAAWIIGRGPSILFVHGWNGRGVQFQSFFQATPDAGFSVLHFDAPAHGLSEGEMTNYMEITESIEQIFKHDLGRNIVGVVAHSLGTSAVINHMSRHQSKIPLVLISAAIELMELLFKNFKLHGVPRETYLKLMDEVEEEFKIPLETQNPSDLVGGIISDVLIIHDVDDRITPVGPSRKVHEQLKNVDLYETQGLGHSLLLKDQVVVNKSLNYLKYAFENKTVGLV